MSEPVLIIPDAHEEIEKVRDILSRYSHIKQKVWLGDFFDSWDRPWQYFTDTVTLVQTLCEDPSNTLILGNHDASYWWGGMFRCSGWDRRKAEYITKHLTQAEWSRFQLYAKVGDYYLSHAGIHPYFFWDRESRSYTFSDHWLNALCKDAVRDAAMFKIHPFLGVGAARCGSQNKGGIIWLDWDEEFEPIPGINQIVGHTYQKDRTVKALSTLDSSNYCLDTGLHHVGIIDGDGFRFEEVWGNGREY